MRKLHCGLLEFFNVKLNAIRSRVWHPASIAMWQPRPGFIPATLRSSTADLIRGAFTPVITFAVSGHLHGVTAWNSTSVLSHLSELAPADAEKRFIASRRFRIT